MMGWYGGGGMGVGPMMLVMGLFWIALLGVIIWAVIKLLPSSGRAPSTPTGPGFAEAPEAILDRMFAMGEIDETTYRTRRTALSDMRRPQ